MKVAGALASSTEVMKAMQSLVSLLLLLTYPHSKPFSFPLSLLSHTPPQSLPRLLCLLLYIIQILYSSFFLLLLLLLAP